MGKENTVSPFRLKDAFRPTPNNLPEFSDFGHLFVFLKGPISLIIAEAS